MTPPTSSLLATAPLGVVSPSYPPFPPPPPPTSYFTHNLLEPADVVYPSKKNDDANFPSVFEDSNNESFENIYTNPNISQEKDINQNPSFISNFGLLSASASTFVPSSFKSHTKQPLPVPLRQPSHRSPHHLPLQNGIPPNSMFPQIRTLPNSAAIDYSIPSSLDGTSHNDLVNLAVDVHHSKVLNLFIYYLIFNFSVSASY
jgi:hypothetical protein